MKKGKQHFFCPTTEEESYADYMTGRGIKFKVLSRGYEPSLGVHQTEFLIPDNLRPHTWKVNSRSSAELAAEIMGLADLKRLAKKLGYKLVKFQSELGSGWHPDDGPCTVCGADQGEECRKGCSE